MKAFEGALDPSRRYIFTFAPHGMLPAAAGFLMHLPSWAAALPGIHPVVLTATVMHYVPLMRDIGGWTGFREARAAGGARGVWRWRGVPGCVVCCGAEQCARTSVRVQRSPRSATW